MSKLWVVIPAAGESRRFKEAGYKTPKPLLHLRNNHGNVDTMINFVKDSIPMGLDVIDVLRLEKTIGQADTVYQTVKNLPFIDSVLILDCDIILRIGDIEHIIEMLNSFDVVMAVTETFDPNASRVNQIPFPTRFVEKETISQYGIISARAFRSCGVLTAALKRLLDECETEPYLSTAMNYYPGTKFAHLITEYVDLGTPQRIKEAGWEIC